jgi:lauroyl/myristoyl acyltransferase
VEKFKGALLVGALRLFALLPWRAVQAVGSAIGWMMWKTPTVPATWCGSTWPNASGDGPGRA